MDKSNYVGSNIRAARLGKDLTQSFVAENIGMPQTAYSECERNINQVSLINLVKISKLLETDINILIFGKTYNDELHKVKIDNSNLKKKIVTLENLIETALPNLIPKMRNLIEPILNSKEYSDRI